MALAMGMTPLHARVVSHTRRVVNGGGSSQIGPGTTVGVVEESFHACPPFLVDLGIVVLGRELHQSLGHDEGIIASLSIEGQGGR